MSNEFGCLPGEFKAFRRMIAPILHGPKRWSPIEGAIYLHCRKARGVESQPIRLAQLQWIERPTPSGIGPTGRTNRYLVVWHYQLTLIDSEPTQKTYAAEPALTTPTISRDIHQIPEPKERTADRSCRGDAEY